MTPEQEKQSKKLHYLLEEAVKINKWREKMLKLLMTDVSPRIAKLDGTGYTGSGFHYGMVQEVGGLIRDMAIRFQPTMNHLDKSWEERFTWMILQVKAEGLIKDVKKAERSLKRKG